MDQILILEPTEETTIETKFTPRSPITKAILMVFNEKAGKIEDMGEVPIFWEAVRAQLHEACENGTAVVARLVRKGRRFELEDVDASTTRAVESLLK